MIGELTNHLWQSTVFAFVAGVLTLVFRKHRAQVRYWLWFSASFKFLLPFSLLISLGSNLGWAPAAKQMAAPVVTSTMVQITQPFPDSLPFAPASPGTRDWVPVAIFGVWACGFAAIALIRLRGWLRIRAAVRASSRIEISAPVEARSSRGLLEPGVVGLWHSILLLPDGIADRLTRPQLEAVLAHELCHIRRRDNLTAAVHMIVEAVFWFHPLVWWIGARLVEERERACDEEVLSLGSAPRIYAEGILNVCKLYVESPLVCVSGVTGADLKKRIEAIMANRTGQRLNCATKLLLATAGSASLAIPLVIGMVHGPAIRAQARVTPDQPGATPAASVSQDQPARTQSSAISRSTERPLAFDAASIKPVGDSGGGRGVGGGGRLRFTPGRVVGSGVTARRIILEAYQLTPHQLSGGPAWLDSDKFSVEAMSESAPDESQLRMMLGTLLSERFKLVAHPGSREMPVYALTVGKGGLRFSKPRNADLSVPVVCAALRPPDQPGAFTAVERAYVGGMASLGTMQQFAQKLSNMTEQIYRPVLDKTGVTGVYQFSIGITASDSFMADVEEQCGLKFESQKTPMNVLIIDRIEKPSAN